jgi:hypothetical protein
MKRNNTKPLDLPFQKADNNQFNFDLLPTHGMLTVYLLMICSISLRLATLKFLWGKELTFDT